MRPRRRPLSPQGDGSPPANGMSPMPGQMQPGQMRPQGPTATSHPPSQPLQPGSAPPPTFAQMQANGQARPAPPHPMQGQMNAMQSMQQPIQQSMQQPMQSQPSPSAGASSFQGGTQGVQSGTSLEQAIQQALGNPSAYGSQQVMDSYNMLNQQLGQDYDYQRKQLNDEMAKRGLSDSTIAGQRYSDLSTEQARAQANMATQLTNQAAQTYGQDRASALNAGLGLGNLGVAQGQLGLGQQQVNNQNTQFGQNLGLQQQQLAQQGSQFGQTLGLQQQQQDLAKQLGLGGLNLQQQQFGLDQLKNTQQYGLQQADLTGSYNGQQTMAAKAQQTAQQEFQQQLAQALGISTMQDKTANRGIDVQGQNSNTQLMLQIMSMMGMGGGGLGVYGGSGGSSGSGGSGSGSSGGSLTPSYNPLDSYTRYLAGNPVNSGSANSATQLMLSDPGTFARMQLQSGNRDEWDLAPSINFGGKQYTTQQYYELMAAHPELFKATNGNAQSNANFFANGQQVGGGSLATNQFGAVPSHGTPVTQQRPAVSQQITTGQPAASVGSGSYLYRDPSTNQVYEVSPEEYDQLTQYGADRGGATTFRSTNTGSGGTLTYNPTYDRWYDPADFASPDAANSFFAAQGPKGY